MTESPSKSSKKAKTPGRILCDAVFADLIGRSGFEGWWGEVYDQKEIRQALSARLDKVYAELTRPRQQPTYVRSTYYFSPQGEPTAQAESKEEQKAQPRATSTIGTITTTTVTITEVDTIPTPP